jgi:uncharacterized membrane protein YecN with MAPEG domain
MTISAFPYFTAATTVFVAIFQMMLLLFVARGRGRFQTGLGDGGHPGLLKRIRMHGNLAENAPLFLILLGLTELSGQWAALVPWFAAAFIVVRLSHALGLLISPNRTVFRLTGVLGTVALILGLAALLAITLTNDTHWLAALPRAG